jgi:hypothetical protein
MLEQYGLFMLIFVMLFLSGPIASLSTFPPGLFLGFYPCEIPLGRMLRFTKISQGEPCLFSLY